MSKAVTDDDSNIEFYSSFHRDYRDALQPVQHRLRDYKYVSKKIHYGDDD